MSNFVWMTGQIIQKYLSTCGQGPSDWDKKKILIFVLSSVVWHKNRKLKDILSTNAHRFRFLNSIWSVRYKGRLKLDAKYMHRIWKAIGSAIHYLYEPVFRKKKQKKPYPILELIYQQQKDYRLKHCVTTSHNLTQVNLKVHTLSYCQILPQSIMLQSNMPRQRIQKEIVWLRDKGVKAALQKGHSQCQRRLNGFQICSKQVKWKYQRQ